MSYLPSHSGLYKRMSFPSDEFQDRLHHVLADGKYLWCYGLTGTDSEADEEAPATKRKKKKNTYSANVSPLVVSLCTSMSSIPLVLMAAIVERCCPLIDITVSVDVSPLRWCPNCHSLAQIIIM